MKEIIKKLRKSESIKILEKETGLIHHFQLNKKESFICWERWVRFPKSPPICHNKYLSLKDVVTIINKLNRKNYEK